MITCRPYPIRWPLRTLSSAATTMPSSAARMGVPVSLAISIPAWKWAAPNPGGSGAKSVGPNHWLIVPLVAGQMNGYVIECPCEFGKLMALLAIQARAAAQAASLAAWIKRSWRAIWAATIWATRALAWLLALASSLWASLIEPWRALRMAAAFTSSAISWFWAAIRSFCFLSAMSWSWWSWSVSLCSRVSSSLMLWTRWLPNARTWIRAAVRARKSLTPLLSMISAMMSGWYL